VLPKDSKILAAWNGLVLSTLVQGTKIQGDKHYRQAANKLVEFIKTRLWDEDSETLYKASTNEANLGDGTLEDYAHVAQGLYSWWELSKDPADKKVLDKIIRQAWKRFYGKQGWHLAENMLLKYGVGQTMVSDSPIPSPSAVLIKTSYQYATATNNKQLQDQALRALNVGFSQLQTDSFWYATQIEVILKVQ
jgi:hypothetical protein